MGKYFVPCDHGFQYGIYYANVHKVFILADAVLSLGLKELQENPLNMIERSEIPQNSKKLQL